MAMPCNICKSTYSEEASIHSSTGGCESSTLFSISEALSASTTFPSAKSASSVRLFMITMLIRRLIDTDYAVETTNMTRNSILQQAGSAILAQANQQPNSVLSLLR